MKVVSQDREPIDDVLHLQRGHVLEISILGRKNNGDGKILAEAFTQLVNQVDLILSIGWVAAAI